MEDQSVTLDVREEIREGRQPCGQILATIETLKPHQDLRLLAPFKPVPLFALLAARGFGARAHPLTGGDWEVFFSRNIPINPSATDVPDGTGPACSCQPVVELDLRGLEPPEPMTRILEACETLPAGSTLKALTDRRPIHLYPLLAQRGFASETTDLPNTGCATLIRRT